MTCGYYEDVYAEFALDSFEDNSTQPTEAVNLSLDTKVR